MKVFVCRKLVRTLATLPLIMLAAGCGDDDSNPITPGGNESPELPYAQSLSISVTGFEDAFAPGVRDGSGGPRNVGVVDDGMSGSVGKSEVGERANADSASSANYNAGRTTVASVNTSITSLASLTSYCYSRAFNTTPVEETDGSWTWSYSVADGWIEYDVVLNGVVSGEETEWVMYVTTSGRTRNVTNMLWASGTTASNNLSGSWQVYDLDAAPATPLVRVDWTRDGSGNVGSVWLNNSATHASYGDNLAFSYNGGIATLEYSKSGGSYQSTVTWNTQTTAGSVRMPLYNGGNEACWDAQHANTSCAQ
jgi:hypothetical protein